MSVGVSPARLIASRGRGAECRRRLVGAGDAPLADPRALDDPRVARVEPGLEVGVRDTAVGYRRAPADNCRREAHFVGTRLSSQATGWPLRSRSPVWASIP